jgi:hypothetical protein
MSIVTAITLQTITVAGGNLYALAAKYLGDATQWNRIAQLNGMTDPFFTSVLTLKIPPLGQGNGGVLGA